MLFSRLSNHIITNISLFTGFYLVSQVFFSPDVDRRGLPGYSISSCCVLFVGWDFCSFECWTFENYRLEAPWFDKIAAFLVALLEINELLQAHNVFWQWSTTDLSGLHGHHKCKVWRRFYFHCVEPLYQWLYLQICKMTLIHALLDLIVRNWANHMGSLTYQTLLLSLRASRYLVVQILHHLLKSFHLGSKASNL